MNQPEPSPAGHDRLLFRLRALIFVLLAAFMLFGPFYRQVLGKRSPYFRTWTMFSGLGVGFDEVRFSRIDAEGNSERLNRFELMGYKHRYKAPKWLKRIPDADTSLRIGHLLCHRLGPEADVRIESRRAKLSGWKPIYRGDKNICLSKPKGRLPDPNPARHRGKNRSR